MKCIARKASLRGPDEEEFRRDGGFQCIDSCRLGYKFYAPRSLALDLSEHYRKVARQSLRADHPNHRDEIPVEC
jgi:hypothetical protein